MDLYNGNVFKIPRTDEHNLTEVTIMENYGLSPNSRLEPVSTPRTP